MLDKRTPTMAPAADGEWIADHRRVWAQKPSLRMVYTRWFRLLREAGATGGPTVELGCGSGFFKELYPDVIATDTVPNPYADRIVDAAELPFANGELANIVLLDVFHHLPAPARFLREVARTLRPGGRLVMLEPWVGWLGRVFYTYVHHEDCDLDVSPADPWASAAKDAMQGNVALPYMYFRPRGYAEKLDLPLRIARLEPFSAIPWLLSGGFQPFTLLPSAIVRPVELADRLVSRLPRLTAVRCLIVVEKL